MDVSGWTVDQRMGLPDWCFPNRQIVSIERVANVANTYYWGISEIAMSDPMCIWSVGLFFNLLSAMNAYFRFGLRDTVPTSQAEMDTADEIFPYFGRPHAGPNELRMRVVDSSIIHFPVRKGMATGGKYLVIEYWSNINSSSMTIFFVVSGLPTRIPDWMAFTPP